MGASSKRGDDSTIGEFGSGWKYALAVLIRNGIEFYIFSGTKKISVSTRDVELRAKQFKMITIGGKDTNYTTEMGPDWTLWMAIREIYSNALDEGGCVIEEFDADESEVCAGKTNIYIEQTDEVADIIYNWPEFFSFDRTDDVLEVKGKLKVFKALRPDCSIIYRKGIKVAESPSKGCYDYDFYNIPINELRVAKNFEDVKEALKHGLLNSFDSDVIKTILGSSDTWEKQIHFQAWDYMHNKKAWTTALKQQTVIPVEHSIKFESDKPKEENNSGLVYVPNSLCKLISVSTPEILVLGYAGTGQLALPYNASEALLEMIKYAKELVAAFGYTGLNIRVAETDNYYQDSFSTKELITLSSKVDGKPYQYIAKLILKEAIIQRSGHVNPSSNLTDYLVSMLYCAYTGEIVPELEETGLPF